MDLREYIRNVPDFPKPGIQFKDITPLLKNPDALRTSVSSLRGRFPMDEVDAIVAIEARGFIFGALVAWESRKTLVPVRKPGKLPFRTITESYSLEYGKSELEIHEDALQRGQRVLIIDDVLATGGTVRAAARLAEKLGSIVVGIGVVIELGFLGARAHLPYSVESLICYHAD